MVERRGRSGITTAELDKRLSLLEAQLEHHAKKADVSAIQTSVDKSLREVVIDLERNRSKEHSLLQDKFDKLEKDFRIFQTEVTTSMRTMRIFIMSVMVIVTIIGELIAVGVVRGAV